MNTKQGIQHLHNRSQYSYANSWVQRIRGHERGPKEDVCTPKLNHYPHQGHHRNHREQLHSQHSPESTLSKPLQFVHPEEEPCRFPSGGSGEKLQQAINIQQRTPTETRPCAQISSSSRNPQLIDRITEVLNRTSEQR